MILAAAKAAASLPSPGTVQAGRHFRGRYRIIDFVLSKFANSGVLRMKVLTQYTVGVAEHAHLPRLAAQLDAGQFVESVPRSSAPGPSGTKARRTPSTRT